MMFLFAYIGSLRTPQGWPLTLMYVTEAAFLIVAFGCIWIAVKGTPVNRNAVAIIGGISASFGLIMPLELAPFFFGVRGEWMLATMGLIVVYPIAALLFIWLLRMLMKATQARARGT